MESTRSSRSCRMIQRGCSSATNISTIGAPPIVASPRNLAAPTRPILPHSSAIHLNYALVDAHIGTAVVEHETDGGLKIKNASRVADYDKFYQNIFPAGPVNAAGTSVNLSAYNNETDRQNLFNQTDLTYKLDLGLVKHTLLWGAEIGRQSGLSFRQDGFFNNVSTTLPVSPLNPTSFVPV